MTDNTCREAFEEWKADNPFHATTERSAVFNAGWDASTRNNDKLLREVLAFFDNKIYILERAPKDELSDRYRVEVTKLRGEITKIKAALGE